MSEQTNNWNPYIISNNINSLWNLEYLYTISGCLKEKVFKVEWCACVCMNLYEVNTISKKFNHQLLLLLSDSNISIQS